MSFEITMTYKYFWSFGSNALHSKDRCKRQPRTWLGRTSSGSSSRTRRTKYRTPPARARAPIEATTQHSFRGSFLAGSRPIFASKYAFFSINFFKIYKKITFAQQILEISAKKLEKFAKILTFFGKFWKFLQNFQKSAKNCNIFLNCLQNFTGIYRFCKMLKMLYWMQKFMNILVKFDEI